MSQLLIDDLRLHILSNFLQQMACGTAKPALIPSRTCTASCTFQMRTFHASQSSCCILTCDMLFHSGEPHMVNWYPLYIDAKYDAMSGGIDVNISDN